MKSITAMLISSLSLLASCESPGQHGGMMQGGGMWGGGWMGGYGGYGGPILLVVVVGLVVWIVTQKRK